ncbi:3-methyl-2-oxobutanoate hydroxymethyltransferase [Kwoniella dendrophila CBS 6074]|uniref:3-methyl-2-oxobutanoate hydroxymethyltransferase n=1 Tax=Kwoniella dendrophila CBS 6074 TaxID=1295534 RepID=A0AAX4JPX6_9TREE
MLPRPARLIHQHTLVTRLSRSSSKKCFTSTSTVRGQPQSHIIQHNQSPSPSIDESFDDLINEDDMGMGMGYRKSIKPGKLKGKGRIPDLEIIDRAHDHAQYPSSSSSRHNDLTQFGLIQEDINTIPSKYRTLAEEDEREYIHEKREERRSPAAVLGSKRIGVVVLPEALKNGIQRQIDQLDNPRTLRRSYLELPSSPSGKIREEKVDHRSSRPRKTIESELAKAAGIMPGEYGVVRNVLEEMDRRLGKEWFSKGKQGEIKEVVEYSGGLGAGLWATLNALEGISTRENTRIQFVHSSRHGLDLAQRITEDIPNNAAEVQYNRKHHWYGVNPTLVLSTFLLSTLPTQPSQNTHLLELLSLDSPYIVLVDRSTPAGWAAMSHARTFLLEQSTFENPLHVIAPCPHDGVCPLTLTGDKCSFSQRLQRPSFVRKTKHSSRGEEDTGYCYVVLARGERPSTGLSEESQLQGMPKSVLGRIGGVGKEEVQKARMKKDGRSVIREIEGHEGIMEVVNLPDYEKVDNAQGENDNDQSRRTNMQDDLRKEAYAWPRLVAPPMKRSGHVTMDACCPDGNIQRLTFSKSHSKQGYHDARKSSWGDIFPHAPKATPVIRTRGVRRLTKPVKDDEVLDELLTAHIEEGSQPDDFVMENDLKDLEKLGIKIPKAEVIEDIQGSPQVSQARSFDAEGPFGAAGQKRSFASVSKRPSSVHSVGLSPRLQSRSMSARPPPRSKVTLASLRKLAKSNTPITVLTAYDYPTALLSESCGVDMTLVGDSLSQVCLGHASTTEITLDEMIHHAKAVTKGAKTPFVFADLPFGSFEISLEDGIRNVIKLVKESGIDGIKIEGGNEIIPLVKKLSEIGIPVMPHLGLQPQRATSLSGYLVQGKTSETAYDILKTAKAMQDAGAFGILLEAIPDKVAKKITEELNIITIGIGAGKHTSGQVLVITDVLGTYAEESELDDESEIRFFTSSTGSSIEPATKLALDHVEKVPVDSSTSSPSNPIAQSEVSKNPLLSTSAPAQLPTLNQNQTDNSVLNDDMDTIILPKPKKSINSPKFVRQFGNIGLLSRRAIKQYLHAVRSGEFPNQSESYTIKKDQYEGFLKLIEEENRKEN